MKKQPLMWIMLSFLFTGCATSVRTVSHYPAGQFQATYPARVMIMTQAPQRPYDVIGEVFVGHAYPSGALYNRDEQRVKEEVAALGGDAVLLSVITECSDVIEPERTVITTRENKYGKKHKSREEVTEVSHYPAQVRQFCHSRGMGQVLKFRDGIVPFSRPNLIPQTAVPISS